MEVVLFDPSINAAAAAHHKLGRRGGEGRIEDRRASAFHQRQCHPSFLPSFLPSHHFTHSLSRPSVRPSVRSKCQGDQLQLRHLLQIVKCHMSERGRGADQVVRPSVPPSLRRPSSVVHRSTHGSHAHVPYRRRCCSRSLEGRSGGGESLSD